MQFGKIELKAGLVSCKERAATEPVPWLRFVTNIMLESAHIWNWVDAHANLPPRARWKRESGCGSFRCNQAGWRRPSMNGGFFVSRLSH